MERVKKRILWLRDLLYRPLQEIDLQIAETRDHRRGANIKNLIFSPIEPERPWGEEWKTAWFRGVYTIKKREDNAKLLLMIETGGESLVYIDGREAGALDRQHKEILLSQRESTTGKHQILIESYAGHRVPDFDPKPIELKEGAWTEPSFLYPFPPIYKYSRLVERNQEAWQLYYHLSTLCGVVQELPLDSMRCHQLQRTLEKAVDRITWETRNKEKRDREFGEAVSFLTLEWEKKNSPTTPVLNLIGHAHIDIAWLWPLKETIRKCGRTFASQLRMMEEYPSYLFLQSQAQTYMYTQEHYPNLFQRIEKAVKEGRWEVEGGMWVEADTNLPSAESLIRQFLLGKGYFLEAFGVDSKVLWLPDVFGYSGNLPQILRGCGVEYFITSKIGWNDTNPFPYDLFRWQGIDGSEVLAHFIKETYNGCTDPENIGKTWRAFKQKDRTDRLIHSIGYGDGGGGITMEHLEYAERLKNLEGSPRVAFGSVKMLMDYLDRRRAEYPIWQGELYLEYHRGTLTSQARTKRDNRKVENLLQEAEFFASLAYLKRADYPEERLHSCWQKLLTNQFHDILPGSSIKEVYEDCDHIYGELARTAHRVKEEALMYIEKGLEKSKHGEELCTLTVWNICSFSRSDLVQVPLVDAKKQENRIGGYAPIERGLDLPTKDLSVYNDRGEEIYYEITQDSLLLNPGPIPGCGYSTFTVHRGTSNKERERHHPVATPSLLKNTCLQLELDDRGRLTSIFDRDEEREILPSGQRGNRLIIAEDLPLNYDAWDIEDYYRNVEEQIGTKVTIERVSSGPLQAKIVYRRDLGEASHISQEIILHRESRRIDFRTEVDWHERHRLLKVAFPMDVQTDRATYEIQGGLLDRPNHNNTSWDRACYEVCGHRFAALTETGYGVALLNDCKYGYEALRKELRLTLLKSPTGPHIEADQGRHIFIYSLLPFSGTLREGRVVEEGYELNTPYTVQLGGGFVKERKSYLQIEGDGVMLLAYKKAQKREGIIIRLYEAYGRRVRVKIRLPFIASRIYAVNLMEEILERVAEEENELCFQFRPFCIKTFLVEI